VPWGPKLEAPKFGNTHPRNIHRISNVACASTPSINSDQLHVDAWHYTEAPPGFARPILLLHTSQAPSLWPSIICTFISLSSHSELNEHGHSCHRVANLNSNLGWRLNHSISVDDYNHQSEKRGARWTMCQLLETDRKNKTKKIKPITGTQGF
jgi:hypothetical protein